MPRTFRGYEVREKIASGGMSTLYLGIQTALNRQVALKMLHPGLADDENFIARFEREAKASSAIGHRNIVSVFDFGEEDDVYYIVMEYVQGMDLKDALSKTETMPPEVVLAVLEEVCYGLEAAHDQGVIHRDIKPGNVMLSKGGEVKIADFGLARQTTDIARISALTLPGSVLGTPAYMSPEQAAGKDVDHRTDIYSLGVMAYELFTGVKPFQGSSYSEIRDQIINQDPQSMRDRCAVTPEIENMVNRMLEKDPDRRFPSMRHVIRAIEDCMEALDPQGGLIKYRRKYITKFAADPDGFSQELRRTSISTHLDRGFYFKKMGLAKIDDAVREFEFVLYLDPQNPKATQAIKELEIEAEESGIRPPRRDRETAKLPPESAGPSTAEPAEAKPTPEPERALKPEPARPQRTKVLSSGGTGAATQILDPDQSGTASRAPSRVWPAGFPRRFVLPAVGVLVLVLVAFLLRPGRGGSDGGAAGVLALESDPPGAAVFVRGPDDAEFRKTGLTTNCRVEDLADGIWEVRLELDGHRSQARRVSIEGKEERLSLHLPPLAQEGQIAITTEPPGATVRLRGAGETEFRPVTGKTPLTTDKLASGSWEVEVTVDGVGTEVRTVQVDGSLVPLLVKLEKKVARGRIAIETDPTGATVRGKGPGAGSFQRLGVTTPGTTDALDAGTWQIRLDKSGYERVVRRVEVVADQTVNLSAKLPRVQAPPEPAGDGYAKIVVVPFADIYLNGRLFENQARRTVVPIASGKSHVLEVRHPAFGGHEFRDVKVAAGDTVDLGRYDFKWGEIRIFCRPGIAADLYIDGQKVDRQTPYSGKIGAGKHEVRVVQEAYTVTEVVVTTPTGERRLRPDGTGKVSVDVGPDEEVRVQFLVTKGG